MRLERPDVDNLDIAGRNVVLVEDIVDTARTLSATVAKLGEKAPASLKTVCLLDKPSRRTADLKEFKADYTGFERVVRENEEKQASRCNYLLSDSGAFDFRIGVGAEFCGKKLAKNSGDIFGYHHRI